MKGHGMHARVNERAGWTRMTPADPTPRKWPACLVLTAILLLVAGCKPPADVDLDVVPPSTSESATAAPPPTLEPPSEKTLIVCLGQEPASLYRYGEAYLYGTTSRETDAVLEAVYDGPIDVVGYEYSPVILERIPTLDNGDVKIESVSVARDEVYLDPQNDEAANLALGKTYLPSGCDNLTCAQKYGGGEVTMDRMVVTFRLRPGLLWSDGQPLTAGDSVFAFKVDSDAGTPTLKYQVDRTGSYEAVDNVTLVWDGIPGYMDAEYPANFWPPLPEHLLGDLSPSDLTVSELTTRRPIGWGPYIVQEWALGEQIVLTKNPQYFRATEGLPRFDRLIFRFVGRDFPTAYQQLLTGECDILDESVLVDTTDPSSIDPQVLQQLKQGVAAGRISLSIAAGGETERLDFNVAPENPLETTPLLADARTRRAIAQCIDRESLASELVVGTGAAGQSYLPPDHPLFAAAIAPLEFDPAQGAALLDEVGWRDEDGLPETPRTAVGISGVANGTPLHLTVVTAPSPLHKALVERIEEYLSACGIGASLDERPAEELLAAWPDGPVFGRKFQTVLWSWPTWVRPACEMFLSTEIPSAISEYGLNASGYANGEYDRACQQVMFGPPEIARYREGVTQTQERFAQDLPALPLVFLPRVAAYAVNICGPAVDASAASVLWNLEEFAVGEDCRTE